MDEHPERGPCTDENCERFAQAHSVLKALRNPPEHVALAGVHAVELVGFDVASALICWNAMLREIEAQALTRERA